MFRQSTAFTPRLLLAIAPVLACFSAASNATSHRTARLESNLLIDGENVLFAQGIGSITKIELSTGDVLLRKPPGFACRYGGQLLRREAGIVMAHYAVVALLDPETLEVIWQQKGARDAAVGKNYCIANDGNRTVTCHRLSTGEPTWTLEMVCGWRLFAEGDLGAVATYDDGAGNQLVTVMDLPTGKVLYDFHSEADETILQVYLFGRRVYLLTGQANRSEDDLTTTPRALVELDESGKRSRTVPYDSEEIVADRTENGWWSDFYYEGLCFMPGGEVRTNYPYEPAAVISAWNEELNYAFLRAGLLLDEYFEHPSGQAHTLIKYRGNPSLWTLFSPHLEGGGLYHVADNEGSVVIGSLNGRVECIDLATGQPRWIYAFPLVRLGVAQYHDGDRTAWPGMMDLLSGPRRPKRIQGSLLLPQEVDPAQLDLVALGENEPYRGRVVFDPSPDRLSGTWIAVLVCCGVPPLATGLTLAFLLARRRGFFRRASSLRAFSKGDWIRVADIAVVSAFGPIFGFLVFANFIPWLFPWIVATLAFVVCVVVASKWLSVTVS